MPQRTVRRLWFRFAQALRDWRAPLRHAFAIAPTDAPLSPEDQALLEQMADRVVRRGLAAPATLFLESVGPLNFLGSQVLYGLAPLLRFACERDDFDRAARVLERRDSLTRLAALIEARAAQTASSMAAPQ